MYLLITLNMFKSSLMSDYINNLQLHSCYLNVVTSNETKVGNKECKPKKLLKSSDTDSIPSQCLPFYLLY